MNLKNIIENHTNALGGAEAVEAIQGIQVDFHLIEPTFEVDGIYSADRTGRMRVDIFVQNVRVFSEGFDGSQGWQLPQDAERSEPTSPAGTIALKNGIENQLYGLHELQSRGHQLELVGMEKVDDIAYFVIKIGYASGSTLWRYINPNTWLIERGRERKALHPDVDPTELTVETQFSDFRQVGGVLRPFHEIQLDLSSGQTLQTTTVKGIKINPPFEPDLFECP